MKKWFIILLCFLMLAGCASSRDYNERRGLMLLEPNEIPRNKPLKYSKKKTKKKLQKQSKRTRKYHPSIKN